MNAMPFSSSSAFSQGWEVFKRSSPLLLTGTIVILGINIGLSMVGSMIQFLLSALGRGTNSIQWVVLSASAMWSLGTAIFISGPMQCSAMYVGVAAWRGEPIGSQSLFRGFFRYWRSIGLYRLYVLLSLSVAVPAVVVIIPVVILIENTTGA
jgi:hypothetical protein